METTQAKTAETAKQKKARLDAMYLDIIDDIKNELPASVTMAETMQPIYRLLVAAIGSPGYEQNFSDDTQQEGLSMCISLIDKVMHLLEPVVWEE